MKRILTRILPDLIAILAFVLISIVFMYPAMSGKTLAQHDATAGIGAGQETAEYMQQTGEHSRWTNALFGGMPTYQSSPSYPASSILSKIGNAYHLFLPAYIWYLFALLLGFYILMRTMRYNVFISSLGAIVWAFSSYFIIIISAGHIWKVMTLAFIPPTIAGMILVYRKQYLLGFGVTAFFAAMQLLSNHLQMTYYFLFVMLALAIAFFAEAIKTKEVKTFFISTAVLAAAGLMGIAVNSSNIYHTWQYSKETMRGGSELVKKDSGNQSKNGLDRDYITQWSYGIDETLTLLVPNSKGGATSKGDRMLSMSESKAAKKVANKDYSSIYDQLPQYFGEQPMTCGPVYVGAFVCLLFVMGLMLVGGPMKWGLLAVTILSILLSWGKNFQWFTDLFIDYIPMYSKFRTVSSILVIAEFAIPMLGIMGLAKYLKLSTENNKKANQALFRSLGITGGIALLIALFPSIAGPALTSSEVDAFENLAASYKEAGYQFPLKDLVENLTDMRHAMISADAWRSLIIIIIGFLLTYAAGKGKVKQNLAVTLIAAVCLIDMWSVDKRYLSDDMFKKPAAKTAEYVKTEADEYILQDKSLDYRVLNLSTDTFNENVTSYFHKSIGGYHAAKLLRYQELIEEHIIPEISRFGRSYSTGDLQVLNMLNTKYIILPNKNGSPIPFKNENAFGNAWFVSNLKYVQNANEEIDALHSCDPRTTAIIDRRFEQAISVNEGRLAPTDNASVTMTAYKPNELKYKASSENGGIVVFSEIWYPGWKAFVDGKATEIARADYVLRSICVPSGDHEIMLEFRPTSLKITNTISFIALALMIISIVGAVAISLRKKTNTIQ